MASPHVAGTAALYLEANPLATPAAVATALKTNATANHVTSAGTGSPNLLLYEGFIGGTPQPPTPTPPGQPVLTATGGNTTVSLSWTAPSPGSQPINGYVVYRGNASGTETLLAAPLGTGTTYLDTGLVNGQTYWYQVSAVSSVGEGAPSVEQAATPQAATPPGTPTLSAAQPWFFFTGVQLSWTVPSAGSSPITGYRIYRSTSPGTEVFYANVGTGTTVRDTGTTRGVRYYYRLSAVSAAGEGPLSNEASAVAR
jgi:titin